MTATTPSPKTIQSVAFELPPAFGLAAIVLHPEGFRQRPDAELGFDAALHRLLRRVDARPGFVAVVDRQRRGRSGEHAMPEPLRRAVAVEQLRGRIAQHRTRRLEHAESRVREPEAVHVRNPPSGPWRTSRAPSPSTS